MSWVGVDDVVGAFHHALFDEAITGAVNVTAPEPVSNAAFTRALGEALHRPTAFPVPAAGLRVLLGRQMADETALSSAWVLPRRLESAGYAFRHRDLPAALAHYLP
jgi:NAD dependent epimerase/dehydratase family enzyme